MHELLKLQAMYHNELNSGKDADVSEDLKCVTIVTVCYTLTIKANLRCRNAAYQTLNSQSTKKVPKVSLRHPTSVFISMWISIPTTPIVKALKVWQGPHPYRAKYDRTNHNLLIILMLTPITRSTHPNNPTCSKPTTTHIPLAKNITSLGPCRCNC